MISDIPENLRPAILDAVLCQVPFDGWNDHAIAAAAHELDLDPGLIELAYPGGVIEMIDAYATRADSMAADALAGRPLGELKIRERIALAVSLRLEAMADHREAARRALSYLSLPMNAAAGTKMAWRTADVLWRAIGDTSTDVSYYTKRGILAAVFSATALYWLNDESEGRADTRAFLDRRINDVMTFEKAKGRLRKYTDRLPDVTRALGKMRYRG